MAGGRNPSDSEWTIHTLKELFESKLEAINEQRKADKTILEAKVNQLTEERNTQAIEYARRLGELNHEAQRIAAANAANLNRDVWDQFVTTNDEWKRRIETAVLGAVTQTEFRSYKDSTSRALQLEEGKGAGIKVSASTIVSTIVAVAALVGIIVAVSAWGSKMPTTTAPPVVYLSPPPAH